ncbi:MAG: hypothetical protein AUK48_13700 [Oscillatoriales cyanobacterium CG2_30_44_21]|nr:MAG: hypothetical protein AUK48_13700 [Oscillatoriales cyanobacterium CG2_30_44_21]
MQFFWDAIACGLLAALTWAGLVKMSHYQAISSPQAWVQGASTVAIANIFVWLTLVGSNLRWIPIWAFCFLMINAAIARLVFPLIDGIQIPRVWSLLIHPVAIALMTILLGGAIGFL